MVLKEVIVENFTNGLKRSQLINGLEGMLWS